MIRLEMRKHSTILTGEVVKILALSSGKIDYHMI